MNYHRFPPSHSHQWGRKEAKPPRKWGRVVLVLLLLASAVSLAPVKMPSKAERLQMMKAEYDRAYHMAIREAACPWAETISCGRCHQ